VRTQLAGLPLRHRDAGPGSAGAMVLALGDRAGGSVDPDVHECVLRTAENG